MELIETQDGSFYGTTTYGGPFGQGTVFKVNPDDGTLTTIYSFQGGSDGYMPAGLVEGNGGRLYGTALQGDDGASVTIFQLTRDGVFSPVYTSPNESAIYVPDPVKLVAGRDGAVYGTIRRGGQEGSGMLFKVDGSGNLTPLHSFTSSLDGEEPYRLALGIDGDLYGLTLAGGANGRGTFFRYNVVTGLTVVRAFDWKSSLYADRLIAGGDGKFYGVTSASQSYRQPYRPATIFQLSSTGDIHNVYTFTDRSTPTAFIRGKDGGLYGTAAAFVQYGIRPTPVAPAINGTSGYVFSVTPEGMLQRLHEFNDASEGSGPASLLQGADGNLYGTTMIRGELGGGTVFQLPLRSSGRLLNIFTRGDVLTGDSALIAGFIISGVDPEKVVVRGVGPSLAAADVGGVLANPTLELLDSGGNVVGANDDWRENEAEVLATSLPPRDSLESALVRTLGPGAYTAVLRGKSNGTGVGLVEVYDLGQTTDSKLANISTRGFVGTAGDVLVGGIIMGAGEGEGPFGRVVVRALGPSLASSGIAMPLHDPTLEVRDSNGELLGANDNWKTRQADIEATGLSPTNDAEAALVVAIPPGSATAIVRGSGGGTGVGLVEVYNIP